MDIFFWWTNNHISELWGIRPQIVYPPCDVEELTKIECTSELLLAQKNTIRILSLGQIRPEKNHLEQIRIFAELRRIIDEQELPFEAILSDLLREIFKID